VILTNEQQAAAEAIDAAIDCAEDFALLGLAGTGKTTVLAHVAARRPDAYLCAPTAKAASVVTAKAGINRNHRARRVLSALRDD
jgi:hypothetical protein